MFSVVYIVLVLFLICWYVVRLLVRLLEHDTINYDMNYLWENYKCTKKDMRFPNSKR